MSKNSNRYWDNARNFALIISIIISIFSVFFHFIEVPEKISTNLNFIIDNFNLKAVQIGINIGNILVSLYFLIAFLRPKKISTNYQINKDKEYKFCELAELDRDKINGFVLPESKAILEGYQKRVAALVIQYVRFIRLFAASFVFLYILIVISSLKVPPPPEGIRYVNKFVVWTNIFNFLGGVVVFLAFWVLYSKTLNTKDKDNQFWLIPLIIAGIYICIFNVTSWLYDPQLYPLPLYAPLLYAPQQDAFFFLNIFDLIAGSVNGLAMFLLFGRYVSLEQSLSGTNLFNNAFKDLFKSILPIKQSYTKIVSFGIIFILPIYALAQPLFGSLEIKLYSNDPKIFQTTVYGICLIGKLCFFHLTYLLIREKLLHLYLYGLVSNVGNFRELEECLNTT